MDYIPKYYKPYELVPRSTYELLKDRPWIIWHLFDPRTLYVSDALRKRYGKMIANTWWNPALIEKYGNHQYRGWRPPGCKVGSRWSQHRFGRANDLDPVQVTVEEIWTDIEGGNNFQWITCIEKSSSKRRVTWLHHDERNYLGLLIVYP